MTSHSDSRHSNHSQSAPLTAPTFSTTTQSATTQTAKIPPANPKAVLSPKTVPLQIGPYQILPIPTGLFGLDGGAMFGTVPKVLWEKQIPADPQNRIPMEARALLLKSPDRNILIDCGNGGHFVEKYGEKMGTKFAQMYNIDPNGPSLLGSLKKHGLEPDDITDVIFTHLHFDHCGGGTIAEGGQIKPQFPRATYYVQKENFEIAQKPNIRERASYLTPNFLPLYEQGKLRLLDGPHEDLLPCVSVQLSHGHTQGQQWIKVSSKTDRGPADLNHSVDSKDSNSEPSRTLAYCADVIATSAHVKRAWVMGYDLDPLKVIEEKTALLEDAAHEGWYLFFEHDPFIDACKVIKNGEDFAVSETFHLQGI